MQVRPNGTRRPHAHAAGGVSTAWAQGRRGRTRRSLTRSSLLAPWILLAVACLMAAPAWAEGILGGGRVSGGCGAGGGFGCAPTPKPQGAKAKDAGDDDDDDDDDDADPNAWPNIYLDMSSTFTASPPNTLGVGARNLINLRSSGSRSASFSFPLTIDLNDRVSVYAGFDTSRTKALPDPWGTLEWGSWTAGASADIIEQDGQIPTVTLSASVGRPLIPGTLGFYTTTGALGLDVDYAFDEDGTRGVLLGASYTRILVEAPIGTIHPIYLAYIGGYYQWDNGVKLTGKGGFQATQGGNVGTLVNLAPVTVPYLEVDVDLSDKSGNTLIGLAAVIAWTPKPAFQLTLSTPLYAVRN